jgi:hypothetical protein
LPQSGVATVPYLQIETLGMKRNTLFKHNFFAITCEGTMADVEEYQILLKLPPIFLEKTTKKTQIKKM